jgi:diadenylate cyclase
MAQLLSFLAENLAQLVDFTLVAILVYYILVFLRGLKTVAVLQGLVALAVVYLLCQYFKLITLVFIIEKILVVGPLIIFVVFAPELRKMLEALGKTSRFWSVLAPRSTDNQEDSEPRVVSATVDAAELLRQHRLGALLVFEGEDKVDDFIVPGTELDAVPSARLLFSLFNTYNPLHDGAVVIRDDRVHSAANFLPLSENARLDDDLGTRHRAAVGLTERCDALVVVVSEERGELSLAYGGRLARNLKLPQFLEQLRAVLEPNENFATLAPPSGLI